MPYLPISTTQTDHSSLEKISARWNGESFKGLYARGYGEHNSKSHSPNLLILGLACATIAIVFLSGICIFLAIRRRILPSTSLGESRRFQEKPKLNIILANGISPKPSRALEECSRDHSDQSFTSEKKLPLEHIEEVSEGEDNSAEILPFPEPTHPGIRPKVAGSPPIWASAPNGLPRPNKLFAETRPLHFQPLNCLAPRSNGANPSRSSWLGSHHR